MLTIDDFTMVDRAEVLFVSALPTGATVTAAQLDDTIAETLRVRGGVTGCAAEMAAVFGESPGFAAERMRWAMRALRPAARTEEAA